MDPTSVGLQIIKFLPAQKATVAALAFLVYDYEPLLWAVYASLRRDCVFLGRAPDQIVSSRRRGCLSFVSAERNSNTLVVKVFTYGIPLPLLSAEIILMSRIYVVYDRKKKLLVVMAILFVAEIICSLVLADTGLPKTAPLPQEVVQGWTGCHYSSPTPPHYFVTWIPALTFELILCLLMVYKGYRMYTGNGSSFLLGVLIRDSILYFSNPDSLRHRMLLTILVNVIIWALAVSLPVDGEIAIGWAVAVPCALGSRLLINMRERYFSEQINGTSQPGMEMHRSRPITVSHGISFAGAGTEITNASA
ncbi:hypothetical protein K439DRAFT_1617786 [Ramaria rubella]|nr:hypothetical protein K439DRAFT_1617786 [Ramaria rubella]